MQRRKSRSIKVGSIMIGGDAPVSVQSMTNTDTRNANATVKQIQQLEQAGCEIVRVAVPDLEALRALVEIRKNTKIPLIADIHYNYRLAIGAIEAGVDGLRINPGNIGGNDQVAAVVQAARPKRIPIRIGVNAGSLEKEFSSLGVTSEAMVRSALKHVALLEKLDFFDIKISLKASDVPLMIQSYMQLAELVDYPLHIGVTEAGTVLRGSIKSAAGIAVLLWHGIGDTIRVSLTGEPLEEVKVGYEILKTMQLRQRGVEIISCPTCGRTQIDLIAIAEQVEKRLATIKHPLRVAVMGCIVNGPGEAKHADIGIAGGNGEGLIFRKGKVLKKVPENLLVDSLIAEIEKMLNGRNWDEGFQSVDADPAGGTGRGRVN